MRATISQLRKRYEEEAVTFGYPRERVFRQAARESVVGHPGCVKTPMSNLHRKRVFSYPTKHEWFECSTSLMF